MLKGLGFIRVQGGNTSKRVLLTTHKYVVSLIDTQIT